MELVRGTPLTDYCDKHALSNPERLSLLIDVCHAIQHAHQKGVIHRDIKPSNVLVTLQDHKPIAKVIDFGVSKAIHQRLTEKTLFTGFGQMVGTPQYMSPEQAEMSGLDIDTRSDIYSLGVLMYELMTGTTPLDGRRLRSLGYAELQRVICEEEPPRPSIRISSLGEQATSVAEHRRVDPKRLRDQLAGELDWIVMKALEKDRGRRYETANALASDTQAPVATCSTSTHRNRLNS
jgi:serine/threonine protein kinase